MQDRSPDQFGYPLGLTISEAYRALAVAKRVTLNARVFERMEMAWDVQQWIGGYVIVLETRARVIDRDLTDGSSDAERIERFFDHAPFTIPSPLKEQIIVRQRDETTRIPVIGSRILEVSRSLLNGDESDLLTFFVGHARRALVEMAMHEIDEQLCVNGTRYHDPHTGKRGM